MADFSKRISILVDFVTGNTSSGLSKIKSDVEGAEGAFGKMKAAGSGAFDLISQNAGAFALGAGTALVGFGVKAVSAFQDTALGAGHLRDALGLSADQASRYLEVSNDLGIGQDSLATAFGRMLKTAGQTPQVFHDLGVQIAYAKDGSVDANQTFLNAVDALHNMTDPAQRAAAATKLFGKSWQDMAEVIDMGAAGLKQRLDDVQSSKIVNDDQIAQGYKFRDALDNVRDAVEGLFIQIGSDLVPTLTTLSGVLGDVLGPLDKFNEGLHKLDNIPGFNLLTAALSPLTGGIKTVSDAWDRAFGAGGTINAANIDPTTQALLAQTTAAQRQANATQQAAASAAGAAPVWAELVNKTGDWSNASKDAALSADDQKRAAADAKAGLDSFKLTLDDIIAKQNEAAGAASGLSSALETVFGSSIDVQAAADGAQNKIAALGEAVKQNSNDFESNSQQARDNREALRGAVEGAEGYITTLAQSGATSEEVGGAYAQLRGQLVQQLVQFGFTEAKANDYINTLGLTPDSVTTAINLAHQNEAKATVLDYIHNHLDAIPASKRTELYGDLQRGDFDAALSLINSIPRNVVVHIQSQVSGALPRTGAVLSAEGRFVPGGSDILSTLGEDAGTAGDEVVLPLGNPQRMAALLSDPRVGSRVAAVLGGGGGAGGAPASLDSGGATIVLAPQFTLNAGYGADAAGIQRMVMSAWKDYVRSNGGGDIRRALGIKTVGPVG